MIEDDVEVDSEELTERYLAEKESQREELQSMIVQRNDAVGRLMEEWDARLALFAEEHGLAFINDQGGEPVGHSEYLSAKAIELGFDGNGDRLADSGYYEYDEPQQGWNFWQPSRLC